MSNYNLRLGEIKKALSTEAARKAGQQLLLRLCFVGFAVEALRVRYLNRQYSFEGIVYSSRVEDYAEIALQQSLDLKFSKLPPYEWSDQAHDLLSRISVVLSIEKV